MTKNFLAVTTAVLLGSISSSVANEGNEKVQQAVEVIKSLCLSGQQYDLEADVDGNITIKSFKPGATGRLSVNIKQADGAVVLRDELRLIGDADIRECTSRHIERVIDAVFEVSPPDVKVSKLDHDSIRKAKFIGSLPGELSFTDFAEGKRKLYYRFSVSSPIYFGVAQSKTNNYTKYWLGTQKNTIEGSGSVGNGDVFEDIYLIPGDYFVSVRTRSSDTATPYHTRIEGVAAD